MFDTLLTSLGWVCILSGAFFIFTGSLGMLRLPDFYARLHPAGITDSFGAPLLLIGLALLEGMSLFSLKIILLTIFLIITCPTTTHITAKAALLSNLKPMNKKYHDE